MPENKLILVVEDDIVMSKYINNILISSGFNVTNAYDGINGLELYKDLKPLVSIIDINMPGIRGDLLIDEIKKIDPNAIILVQTTNSIQQQIIDIMKKGVYDYFIKPINAAKYSEIVKKAFEHAQSVRINSQKELQEKKRIQEELDWVKWKQDLVHKSNITKGKNQPTIFYFLSTYLSQGAGIGVLVSLVKMMLHRPTINNNNYLIGEDIMELLKDNMVIVDKTLNTFSELDNIINNEMKLSEIYCEEVDITIGKIILQLNKYTALRNHTIKFEKTNEEFKKYLIHSDIDNLYKILYELIINALKFSRPNSEIEITFNVNSNEDLEISIINYPELELIGMFPENIESIVFEPFFRISNAIDESYRSLDFGLGLTFINYFIKKTNGSIKLIKILDGTNSDNTKTKLNFQLSLPAEKKKNIA